MIVEPFPSNRAVSCDVFCRVVDNFGDVGVCWRLARQLAHEHAWRVRLIVDDLASFARLCPCVDVRRARQCAADVEIVAWDVHAREAQPVEVVIEAFACALPRGYAARMPGPTKVWLNLEYLSAEPWIDDCHGLASPSANGVAKFFFFPGFSARSGGLSIERDYPSRRSAFVSDPRNRAALLAELNIAAPPSQSLALAFCYPCRAYDAWARAASRTMRIVRPYAPAFSSAAATFSDDVSTAIPFVPQERFDELLWSCDFAVVRGEDSIVRAQLAALPFIWHIYPQSDGAHLDKLDAFAHRYLEGCGTDAAAVWRGAQFAWNEDRFRVEHWQALSEAMPALRAHAQEWAARLHRSPSLAQTLVGFVLARL